MSCFRVVQCCLLLLLLSVIDGASDAHAEKDLRWAETKLPSAGPALAIGGYSRGCVQGAVAIPSEGSGYQAMRPSRNRFYGHPDLVHFIEEFAQNWGRKKGQFLLVGDLGQAVGGPSPSGHASHQSGLDVDIWFWHPRHAERRSLSGRERESLSARRIVDVKGKRKTKHWRNSVQSMLRVAASAPEVSRIFVNPRIKSFLCESKSKNRKYLRKIRPWYGHVDHMHVRLHCPKSSPECEAQKSLPRGDGCKELNWWFDEKAQAARRKSRKKYQAKVGATPTLPDACVALLSK